MCGIAGYFGNLSVSENSIKETLKLMANRGPDFSKHLSFKLSNNLNLYLLHSRLSIIDLHPRSNQPFQIGDDIIIYNGEIYNYLELAKNLISKKIKLKTNSDTEVLLNYYKMYGEKCVNYFEGMWSFAIFNIKRKELFLSRDRFAEKPLYFYHSSKGIYFGSETKFIRSLSNIDFEVNEKKINTYLSFGYKSLVKNRETYFKKINSVLNAENLKINEKLNLNINKYWSPKISIDKKITNNEAKEKLRELLIQTTKLRMRSDVPKAFCLSGGVDSGGLASIAVKKLNQKIKTFSIIDNDNRYDEKHNIEAVVNDLECEHQFIQVEKKNFFEKLSSLIRYHDGPVITLSQYLHSLLMSSIKSSNCKVAISGTSADELFTGYYDHFLLHLDHINGHKNFQGNLNLWKEHIAKFIRDPILKDSSLYIKDKNFRNHIYDNKDKISVYLNKAEKFDFKEFNYAPDLFSNRRLNELFHEITPPILVNEDLNSMMYSIENRSPYLDKELFEYCFSIPPNLLIQNGYGKYLLRESLEGILHDQVRLDRSKKGFNCSIDSLIDFKDKKTKEFLLSDSTIFNYINKDKLEVILNSDYKENYISKFLFYFISSKMFLDQNAKN